MVLPGFLRGTIRENLVYNKKDVTDRRLDEVCEATGLTDFIRKLPKGYDTVISDQTSLSAGQKQLITIAGPCLKMHRSLFWTRQPVRWIPDRAEGAESGRPDAGAHELRYCAPSVYDQNADLILVMKKKDGDIIESGNHEELLKKNFYASLYNSQFEQAS